MAVVAHALVTVAQLTAELTFTTAVTADQTTRMEQAIDGVTDAIESYQKTHYVARTYTERLHGNGRFEIYLERSPLISLTSLEWLNIDDTLYKAWVENDDFYLDLEAGKIRLFRDSFPLGRDNVKAVYTAGYATLAAVPGNFRAAALTWARILYREWTTNTDRKVSESVNGVTTTYDVGDIPRTVKGLLKNSKTPAASA